MLARAKGSAPGTFTGGRIVNIASMAGLRVLGQIGVYAMSKAAVVHMTRVGVELLVRVRNGFGSLTEATGSSAQARGRLGELPGQADQGHLGTCSSAT